MKTATTKIQFENLDGLRFLCFFSVFIAHSFHSDYDKIYNSKFYFFLKDDVFGNGNLGVNFFFVLSGFLITYLLIKEKEIFGQIHLKHFWLRRILRIWPLFYFAVLFGFFVFPLLKTAFGQVPHETANIQYYLLFLNNFDFINNGIPDASILGVLWSVAIEEQFYLVWPLVLYFLPIKRYWIVFSTVIIGSLLFRILNPSPLLHEYHSLSCMGDLAIGAFGAWLLLRNDHVKLTIENLSKWTIVLIYLAFLGFFLFRDELIQSIPSVKFIERTCFALVVLLIILEQNYAKNSFFKMSSFKLISKLGKLSYGMYCLHFIGILVAMTVTKKLGLYNHLWLVIILSLAVTIAISYLSYRFFERPFLKIKEKFAFFSRT